MTTFQQEGGGTESSHMENVVAEGEHPNDFQNSATSALHSMVRQDSNNSTSARRESVGQDRNSLHVPVSETLPTDMSDTTESEAEKHSGIGKYTSFML